MPDGFEPQPCSPGELGGGASGLPKGGLLVAILSQSRFVLLVSSDIWVQCHEAGDLGYAVNSGDSARRGQL